MAFKMVATDMDWTMLDAEKRIPTEVFEGFKMITLTGGYVVIDTGRWREWNMSFKSAICVSTEDRKCPNF